MRTRTDLCAVMAKLKNIFKVTLIWDCRGFAQLKLITTIHILSQSRNYIFTIGLDKHQKISDKVVVVSTALEKLVKNTGNFNTYLIPSVASKNLYLFLIPKIRIKMRKKMRLINPLIFDIFWKFQKISDDR